MVFKEEKEQTKRCVGMEGVWGGVRGGLTREVTLNQRSEIQEGIYLDV